MTESPEQATPDPGVAAPDPQHEPDEEPRFAPSGDETEDDTPELPQPDDDQEED
jgi:hypothetical protein